MFQPWYECCQDRYIRESKVQSGIEVKVVPFNCDGEDGIYRQQFHKMRSRVFCEQKGWDLSSVAGCEYDEYDCHLTMYVLAIDKEKKQVVGGARLIRTDREEYVNALSIDPNSYMIRDAYLQRIEGIPSNLCFLPPPVSADTWELTRIISNGKLRVAPHVLLKANEYLLSVGAKQCLFLGPPSFMRMAKMMGFSPRPMGNLVSDQHSTFLAFSTDVCQAPKMPKARTVKPNPNRASGDPVAELFNEKRDRVGIVFKWNTGEEQVRWSIPWEGKEPEAAAFMRVELPAKLAS